MRLTAQTVPPRKFHQRGWTGYSEPYPVADDYESVRQERACPLVNQFTLLNNKQATMDIQVYVGADIAAESIQLDWLDIASQQHQQVTVEQRQRAFGQLVKQLTRLASPE